MTKSSPFSHIGYFYLFDWLEILVWYIICQVKPTCKISDSNSISKSIFALHAPSKHNVSTPLWRNGVQFCTSYTCICSIDLKFQYDTLFAKLNRHAKFQTVTRSRSWSLHCMYRLNTVFYTLMTKWCPVLHIVYLYLFDLLEILVWYIICQVKPTCKVSDSNSISKLIFTLHVPSKHSVSTPLWRNGVQFCTSYTCICSIDLKF